MVRQQKKKKKKMEMGEDFEREKRKKRAMVFESLVIWKAKHYCFGSNLTW